MSTSLMSMFMCWVHVLRIAPTPVSFWKVSYLIVVIIGWSIIFWPKRVSSFSGFKICWHWFVVTTTNCNKVKLIWYSSKAVASASSLTSVVRNSGASEYYSAREIFCHFLCQKTPNLYPVSCHAVRTYMYARILYGRGRPSDMHGYLDCHVYVHVYVWMAHIIQCQYLSFILLIVSFDDESILSYQQSQISKSSFNQAAIQAAFIMQSIKHWSRHITIDQHVRCY